MARVTVEDCVEVVNNRFELVVLAGQRAKEISAGATLTVDRDNDKNAVVALREIADRTVNVDILRESVVRSMQKRSKFDDKLDEEDLVVDEVLEEDFSDKIPGFASEDDLSDDFGGVTEEHYSFDDDLGLEE